VKSARQPRTIRLERTAAYLLGAPNGPATRFQAEAAAFRNRWGIPPEYEGSFLPLGNRAQLIHDFWSAFARARAGTASPSAQRRAELLAPDPWEKARHDQVAAALKADGYDLSWFTRLPPPEERPDPFSYLEELRSLITTWTSRYGCIEKLYSDGPDLLLDLVFQPKLLLARLEKEYRWFDYIRSPDDDSFPLLHTFTFILPDATLSLDRGTTAASIATRTSPPVSAEVARNAAGYEPEYRAVPLRAHGHTKPSEVTIHTRAGISRNSLRDFVTKVSTAVRKKEGLFADLDKRELALERRNRKAKNRIGPDKTDLVRELSRVHAGEPRARVVEDILERLWPRGRYLEEGVIEKAMRELEREGFSEKPSTS
jgi:hypothetical protein